MNEEERYKLAEVIDILADLIKDYYENTNIENEKFASEIKDIADYFRHGN